MKKYIILSVVLITISTTFAQSPVEDKIGSWFTYGASYRLTDKVSISNVVQSWHYEIPDNFNFLFTSLVFNYHVNSKLTASASYGFNDIDSGFNKPGTHTYENRFYEQLGYKQTIAKLPFDLRIRLEQRLLNKPEPTENVLHHRTRYRLGTKIKLNNTFFIRLHNEFIWTIQTNKNDGFTENRAYGAFGVNVFKSANVQVGYLNRKVKGLDLHRLQLGFFYKIDFRKTNN
ncbi:DUF2490 domain-containing protein [Neotamlana laminarinivorans]|uniref:DUF2490 domain-containing protein n=1 Tax=Neotamlana laminarinivorans TaxID=2883124 RepID=A0A9X1HZF5_9FLAO|nr:DUF2490 domain-containing protein [Tamlana laminarinivorans]MCB4797778.1 DUF2490 domain-containing protein [Tamlana laminarinivorans]